MGNGLPPGIGKGMNTNYSRIFTGRIIGTNKAKYLVDVVDSFGRVFDNVQMRAEYLNTDGGGTWTMPEVNTQVLLASLATSSTPIVLGFLAGGQQLSEDAGEDPTDGRQNRPIVNDGDRVIARSESGFVIARRHGTIEVGGSQVARRWYIPNLNTIRDLAENYELLHTGGELLWNTRRNTEGGNSATEMKLNIRESVEGEDIVKLALGRIEEEEGQKLVDGEIGAAVVKFFVNNRFRLWIDRDGNIQTSVFGTAFNAYSETRKEFNFKDVLQEVKGLLKRSIGNEETTFLGNKQQTIQGDKLLGVNGNSTEFVEGRVDKLYGPLSEEVRGDATRKVIGTENVERTGGLEDNVAEGRVVGTGGDKTEIVAKTSYTQVKNADGESRAAQVLVDRGDLYTHNKLGNVKTGAGGVVDREVASVDIRPNGTVRVDAFRGIVNFEVNKTGCRIKTPGGVIEIDVAGKVVLGPQVGLGKVVTTLTYPFDLVTGIPINGSSSVLAGGAPSPGPAVTGTSFSEDG